MGWRSEELSLQETQLNHELKNHSFWPPVCSGKQELSHYTSLPPTPGSSLGYPWEVIWRIKAVIEVVIEETDANVISQKVVWEANLGRMLR